MILCKYWSLPVRQDLGTFSVSNMGEKWLALLESFHGDL
jgi:hypothetical protein